MFEHNQGPMAAPLTAELLAESNHRIANNLAVVAGFLILQANRIVREGGPVAPCEVHSILSAASAKIAAAGNLHRMLTTAVEGVIDLGEYLEQVARTALEAMSDGTQFTLEPQFARGCLISSDQGLNLGLFLGELVINAIKHAHPSGATGLIEAGCAAGPIGIVAWVRDDGVGFAEGFDLTRDSGVGLRTLRVIAQQTGVELDFVSSELGLTVELHIPQVVMRIRESQFV